MAPRRVRLEPPYFLPLPPCHGMRKRHRLSPLISLSPVGPEGVLQQTRQLAVPVWDVLIALLEGLRSDACV